ncbi:NAD-dependent epimerase/dehydratase family protein [Hymenobacter sp. RP-2-7]|uniref:NAD-dependent epimerase/dehydratase family protein n=1 Tax=Hymenobacter polaris TaxID=2682546 RepID=A0A7Y0AH67_9BACT|nr:NAD-dependent epimerase/dehydratase family protein [Hymenobacter polaris]NML67267.1 NAD-dependent epimerase/dehydratase family protein [Hymenobacter polaris]
MIFVTGGTGLIGAQLLGELRARQLPVRALYRGDTPPALAPAGVEWVAGDLLDPLLLASAITPEVTHVFHCAGLVSYAPQDEENLLQVNVEGTANVVDVCLARPGVRLGYVSSVAALGQPAAVPAAGPLMLDETATWDLGGSHSAYATSKYLAELEVWRGAAEGLQAVIINPSVVLGGGNWHRSSTRLLRYAYEQHHFYTRGVLNFVDVRDVVAHFLRLMLELPAGPTERYILNGGAYPLGNFLAQVAQALGRRPPTTAVPNWAAEVIWRLERARALLTGARPLITRDTARAGRQVIHYDTRKVQKATSLEFIPLADTIAWAAQQLAANLATLPTVIA